MSKATNRLIQEQVTEARQNIDLTTIIAVAVSGYRHLAPLAGPRRDLDMIREILVENPATSLYKEEQLITLLDPTSAEFRGSILQYAEARGARGDVVIFYFSGHGSVLGGGEFLLCTTDSRTSGLEGGGVFSTSAVLFKDIALTLSSCDVRPVFIIDACFSGTTALADGFQIGQMVQNETFTFGNTYGLLCSSSAEVESKDTPQGGAFTLRFHQSIQEGSGNASDRNRPLLTVNDITIPLLDHLARDGYPLPRLFVGPQLPQIAIAKNTQYQPERIRFEPYMKRLVEHLWNKGNPREIAIRALRQNEWMGAYGNHRKLSYSPWQLLEDGSSRRHRRLTKRGEEFAHGDLQIVESIIKDPGTWEWVADPYAEMISISDV